MELNKDIYLTVKIKEETNHNRKKKMYNLVSNKEKRFTNWYCIFIVSLEMSKNDGTKRRKRKFEQNFRNKQRKGEYSKEREREREKLNHSY